MNVSFVYTLLKAAKITAILSFLGGTFLLIAYFYHLDARTIVDIVVYVTLLTLLINSILFFTLLIMFLHNNLKQKNILKSLIRMIVNVPIGLCYAGAILSYSVP